MTVTTGKGDRGRPGPRSRWGLVVGLRESLDSDAREHGRPTSSPTATPDWPAPQLPGTRVASGCLPYPREFQAYQLSGPSYGVNFARVSINVTVRLSCPRRSADPPGVIPECFRGRSRPVLRSPAPAGADASWAVMPPARWRGPSSRMPWIPAIRSLERDARCPARCPSRCPSPQRSAHPTSSRGECRGFPPTVQRQDPAAPGCQRSSCPSISTASGSAPSGGVSGLQGEAWARPPVLRTRRPPAGVQRRNRLDRRAADRPRLRRGR